MDLQEQFLRVHNGNRVDAAAALGAGLMEGDAASFKVGYSADNAVLAVQELFGLEPGEVEVVGARLCGLSTCPLCGRTKQEHDRMGQGICSGPVNGWSGR